MFDVIAFDADDTLWHNESLYNLTQERFTQLLTHYRDTEQIGQELYETEMRNLRYFGYGIKGFTLSMIETAIQLTNGEIRGRDIQHIIDYARDQLAAPVELLPHVAEIIPQLAQHYRLMIITKGDLFDQETKIARSGLADYFSMIEIVSDKTPEVYQRLLLKYGIHPRRFVMIGNSPRSDILPVVQIGARAIYVPYHVTWQHEQASIHEHQGYIEIEHLGLLPALLAHFPNED